MKHVPFAVPPFIKTHLDEDYLHVFLIQSPLALIMLMMIAEAYHIPSEHIVAVSVRNTDVSFAGVKALSLGVRCYDRYINRLTGRSLAAFRLRRTLNKMARRYVIYASWVYPEVEELLYSPRCVGHVIFEDGQGAYRLATPYKKSWRTRWLFRRKKVAQGSIHYYYREDSACYIGLSPEAFPLISRDKRHVLTNMAVATNRYAPHLKGVRSIGLMPAPRRLLKEDLFPAIDLLVRAMGADGGVIKMHPGFLADRTYSAADVAHYIANTSSGRVSLCPDDVLIELEMLVEEKELYGTWTSLSRYAEMLGSKFHTISFKNYIPPNIQAE